MTVNKELIQKFKNEASMLGPQVYVANTKEEALSYILKLIQDKDIKVVVKSGSELAARLGLREHLEKNGVKVTETQIVQWILDLSQGKAVPLEQVAGLVSSATGDKVAAEPEAILVAARRALKDAYINADLGITQADFGIAETGTLVTLENEGNARLSAALPRLHLTLLQGDCIVSNLAEAADRIKSGNGGLPGHKVPTFITYLTGRNTTADIPGAIFARAQGPAEEHILLINKE